MEPINLDEIEATVMDNETYDKGQKVRLQLDQMINQLGSLQVGMPLTWLYVWDVIKSSYADMSQDEGYFIANPDKTIDDVWNALWESPQFTLEFGLDQLDEEVRDWLTDEYFILSVEEGEDEDE